MRISKNKDQDYFTLLIYDNFDIMPFFSWVVMYHFTCIRLKIFKAIFVLETRIHTGKLENFQGTLLLEMAPLLKSGSFSNVPSYSRLKSMRLVGLNQLR